MLFGVGLAVFFVVVLGAGAGIGCGVSPTSSSSGFVVLSGVITSSVAPNAPIAGASVTITATGLPAVTVTTSPTGAYSLSGLTTGTARVELRAAGFQDRSTQVSLKEGANTLNLSMTPNP
jgi:hypothetical protein